tara:strand:- start:953 stop:1420 length:468 start_codon:yes stop_codon:yes gene_type:complete
MLINFSDQDKVIIEKIQSYCLYQDRCIKEVKNKLFSLKVNDDLGQKIINHLIDNDYLNEERFVKLFIQGKLRIKKWGKIKLKYELKIRGINNNTIDTHIKNISEDEYISYFDEFSSAKIKFLKGTLDKKKRSFINYFTYRGWENQLIYQKLKDIN